MTILAGSNAQTGVYAGVGGTGSFSGFAQKYVAVATGAATNGYVWLGQAALSGLNTLVAVYNFDGSSLLGSSAATLISVGNWTNCTFSAGPTLNSGTTYVLAIYVGAQVYFDVGNAAFSLAAAVPHYSNPASDPTISVPSTFNVGINYLSSADMSIYVTNEASASITTTAWWRA